MGHRRRRVHVQRPRRGRVQHGQHHDQQESHVETNDRRGETEQATHVCVYCVMIVVAVVWEMWVGGYSTAVVLCVLLCVCHSAALLGAREWLRCGSSQQDAKVLELGRSQKS